MTFQLNITEIIDENKIKHVVNTIMENMHDIINNNNFNLGYNQYFTIPLGNDFYKCDYLTRKMICVISSQMCNREFQKLKLNNIQIKCDENCYLKMFFNVLQLPPNTSDIENEMISCVGPFKICVLKSSKQINLLDYILKNNKQTKIAIVGKTTTNKTMFKNKLFPENIQFSSDKLLIETSQCGLPFAKLYKYDFIFELCDNNAAIKMTWNNNLQTNNIVDDLYNQLLAKYNDDYFSLRAIFTLPDAPKSISDFDYVALEKKWHNEQKSTLVCINMTIQVHFLIYK